MLRMKSFMFVTSWQGSYGSGKVRKLRWWFVKKWKPWKFRELGWRSVKKWIIQKFKIKELEYQGDISKTAVNFEILKYCREAHNKYHNFLNDNELITERTAKEINVIKSTVKNDISRDEDIK